MTHKKLTKKVKAALDRIDDQLAKIPYGTGSAVWFQFVDDVAFVVRVLKELQKRGGRLDF